MLSAVVYCQLPGVLQPAAHHLTGAAAGLCRLHAVVYSEPLVAHHSAFRNQCCISCKVTGKARGVRQQHRHACVLVHRAAAETPRAGASCPGTPKAPGTAGRLPAQWHSKKMQELDSLQVRSSSSSKNARGGSSRSMKRQSLTAMLDLCNVCAWECKQQRANICCAPSMCWWLVCR